MVHLIATHVRDRTELLDRLEEDRPVEPPTSRGDMTDAPYAHHGHPRNVRILPKSRDFH